MVFLKQLPKRFVFCGVDVAILRNHSIVVVAGNSCKVCQFASVGSVPESKVSTTDKHVEVDGGITRQNRIYLCRELVHGHFVVALAPMVKPTRPELGHQERLIWLEFLKSI